MKSILIAAFLLGTAPAYSMAVCGDGHTSYARRHGGACSHHGGVASWGAHRYAGGGRRYFLSPRYSDGFAAVPFNYGTTY